MPLIIKYPSGARADTVDENLARSLDIAPTILDVLGLEVPAVMQGTSLRRPGANRTDYSFAEDILPAGVMALRTPQFKLIEVAGGNLRGRAPTQLYDLVADPGETVNLADTRPDLVAQLRGRLSQTLTRAERAAVSGQTIELDEQALEQLHRLGY
ncbi:MAG: hypothetical protein KKA73_01240 [Chloroflexi bacterium]|nr:hypothetical protein [Chloroflexota bacterium]MBU1746289.1 hypothetical protein [Chloroflexota bacterium]